MTLEEAIKNREKFLKYLEDIGAKATPECVEAVRWSVKALKKIRDTPVNIDREAWTAEWKEYTGADAGFHYCSKCKQQAFSYEENRDVVEVLSEFCHSCGRAMTPEAWDDLEKRLMG